MGEYRPGVLIHNWNEDQFGHDLVDKGKQTFPTPPSITQTAFRNPKAVDPDIVAGEKVEAVRGLDGRDFFEI